MASVQELIDIKADTLNDLGQTRIQLDSKIDFIIEE
jgi:hypothetical protein